MPGKVKVSEKPAARAVVKRPTPQSQAGQRPVSSVSKPAPEVKKPVPTPVKPAPMQAKPTVVPAKPAPALAKATSAKATPSPAPAKTAPAKAEPKGKNITKYALSESFGVGIPTMSTYSPKAYDKSMYVSVTTEDGQIKGETVNVSSADLSRLATFSSLKEPIYIVFDGDDNQWHEFFTYKTVTISSGGSSYIRVDSEAQVCDYYNRISVGSDYFKEISASVFAGYIARYSDDTIRMMISKIEAMDSAAKEWSRQIKNKCREMLNEKNRREREFLEGGRALDLADMAGGYGRRTGSSSPAGSSLSTGSSSTAKKNNADAVDSESVKRWKKYNLCAHCGGEFKGLLKKTCRLCGKEKDY